MTLRNPPTRRNISSHRRDEIYRLVVSSSLVATLVSRLSSTTEIRSLTTASILCFTSLSSQVRSGDAVAEHAPRGTD